MLGAPPAFVLSQDQTLYKWYLSLKSVKSLFAQHAIACVLCELLCLELFTVFFQHENRFRYKFFDIVQFSRSCWRLSRPADDLIILPQKWFFVKLFFEVFRFLFEELIELRSFLRRFCQTLAWRECILAQHPAKSKTFFQFFSWKVRLLLFAQFFVYFSGDSTTVLPKGVSA